MRDAVVHELDALGREPEPLQQDAPRVLRDGRHPDAAAERPAQRRSPPPGIGDPLGPWMLSTYGIPSQRAAAAP